MYGLTQKKMKKRDRKQYSKALTTKQNISKFNLVLPCCIFLCFFVCVLYALFVCFFRCACLDKSTAPFWVSSWPFHYHIKEQ